jgi:hypothetical protein
MWTKARCVAALEGRLPGAFAVEVRFRKPILLPTTVAFSSALDGEDVSFSVKDARTAISPKKDITHLEGRIRPDQTGGAQ